MSAINSEIINLRDGKFDVELMVHGSGDPLVYIHGADGFPAWESYLQTLSEHYKVYVPAQPGISKSTGLEHLDNIWDLVLFYDELFTKLNLKNIHLVGHSYGGMIAAEIASSYPERIKTLTLVSSLGLWNEAEPIKDFFILTSQERNDLLWYDNTIPIAVAKSSIPTDPMEKASANINRIITLASVGKFCWPIPDRGLTKRIHRLNMPVLLIWGDHDQIVPLSYGHTFNSLINNSKLSVLKNTGHIPQLESETEFIKAITGFCK
jgi:pimeloyl-ACP methyl ester carboxylesterase